jgi:hypothetical protein
MEALDALVRSLAQELVTRDLVLRRYDKIKREYGVNERGQFTDYDRFTTVLNPFMRDLIPIATADCVPIWRTYSTLLKALEPAPAPDGRIYPVQIESPVDEQQKLFTLLKKWRERRINNAKIEARIQELKLIRNSLVMEAAELDRLLAVARENIQNDLPFCGAEENIRLIHQTLHLWASRGGAVG